MKLFFGKGKIIEENIFQYLGFISSEKEIFVKALIDYLETGKIDELHDEIKKVHSYESKADDLRRNIEHTLYGKVLLPEFRGDIIRLLERLDNLPNECQTILYMIVTENLVIPEVLKEKIIELIQMNALSIDEVIDLIKALFNNPKEVEKYVEKIDELESKSDGNERELITKIFSSKSIDRCDRCLFKELVLEIGSISDYAERISDMATIINIKVKV